MKFLRLRVHNLFSIGDAELELNDQGILLVTGYSYDEGSSNGAGKSSLANKAILWGLYGTTAGGLRADAVINRNATEKGSWVEIEFDDYKIKRSRNPNKLTFSQNGKDISQRNERDTQELINTALGRDFKTFIQCDFFGQGRDRSFLSLTPKDQKEILEEILPMQVLSKWADSAKEYYKKVAKLEGDVATKHAGLLAVQEEARSTAAEVHANFYKWEKTRQLNVQKVRTNISEGQAKIQRFKVELDLLNERIEKLGNTDKQRESMLDTILEYRQKKALARAKLDLVLRQSAEITDQKNSVSPMCPTCEQSVDVEQFIKKLDGKLGELHMQVQALTNELTSWDNLVAQLMGKHDTLKDNAALSAKLSQEAALLENKILSTTVDSDRKRLEDLETQTNPFQEMIDRSRENLENICAKLDKTEEDKLILREEKVNLDRWHTIFSKDLRNFIIKQSCPFLTTRASKHLESLGNPQIKINFSTEKTLRSEEVKEEFNTHVHSDSGGDGFDSLSGGEQQISSFAAGLALAELASMKADGESSLLILDEPFLFLDDRNAENIVNHLQNIDKDTVLLISNEKSLKSLVTNQVNVVKRNGVSKIG